MSRKKIIIYVSLLILIFTISFTIAYNVVKKHGYFNRLDETKYREDYSEKEDLNILANEVTITPNTIIENRTHYRTCDHLIVDSSKADDDIINMDKVKYEDYLAKNNLGKKLISFSVDKVVIWEQRNHLCMNHYIIGQEDGYISVFRIDKNGERILENIFDDYPVDLLMEIDKNKIEAGIIVDSLEELSTILENFIS